MIKRVAALFLVAPLLILTACSADAAPLSQPQETVTAEPELTACEVFDEEEPRLAEALGGTLGDSARADALSQLIVALEGSSDHETAIPTALEGLAGDTADNTIKSLTSYCAAVSDGVSADYLELVNVQNRDAKCLTLSGEVMTYLTSFSTMDLSSPDEASKAATGARALADSMDADFPTELGTISSGLRVFADQTDASGLMTSIPDTYSAIDWNSLEMVCPTAG